ncbi:zinc-dependent metalloprotease [Paenimyroides baculatum]|uniref:T9SS type A sorting domain-containing protein n=1 Tax=Paenimyroides baculatum TaxID=2608000 RepID=A0A5M6CAB9_9FLAO|nr:zinc-dependent metalloprotease [Paenimyroides baculatum]KAA5531931.1 T9SS type A sorting domain-containing protein [Paenimyroides baculatum]
MKFYNKLILILLIFFTGNLFAQFNPFKESTERVFSEKEKFVRKHNPSDFKIYNLNLKNVLEWAKKAPELSERPSDLVITLPDASGQLTNYWVYNNAAMESELAENVQNIRSLKAVDTKNNGNSVSISISDIFGFHAMGMKTDGSVFYMDNYTNDLNNVIVYQRNLLELPKNNFTCLVPGDSFDAVEVSSVPIQTLSLDDKRRTYRLALACTIEYAAFHVTNAPVGTPNTTVNQKKDIVLAAMNVTLTRLNQIFERELNVHLNLVANNRDIIFITSDNFSNNDDFLLIDESQTVIDNVIGTANYDMGHTFSTGGGGLASLGSVCSSWSKASGITGSPSPVGDPYDIDYVSHEMGHQFGANHTQNNSCQRNNSTAVETGSGTTIMSYAGICAPNVQSNAEAYYHYVSIREMQSFLLSATCAQQTTVTNSPPVVNALIAKTIPYGTPFILSATATDPNTADQLTYTFEQVNTQIATQPPVATSTTGPAFRPVAPSTNNFRSFPSTSTVLDGTTNTNGIVSNNWERLATVARTYSFVATVRDNNATGARVVYTQPVTITAANTGPFVITAPNNNSSTKEPVWFMGSTKTITWNVAGTTANNINTTNVNILVSTDNGLTYNSLAANVPNNGSAIVTVPTNLTSTYEARIKIEAVGNIFYTVSKKFTLWDPNLSTEEVTLDNLKIYPNPTTNILNIEFSSTDIEKVKFDIFDLNGRLIKTVSKENSNQVNQQINVESLQTGTYILVINTGKYTSTHKFIKK